MSIPSSLRPAILTLLVLATLPRVAAAQSGPQAAPIAPAALFSDHMVLQNGMTVPVWGMADPGEKVTVKIAGQTKSATADATGKWMVKLEKLKSGGPFTMTIAGGKGSAPLTINDVLVGEVWLGSGQSNMVFNVSNNGHRPYGLLDEKQEIAAANYPQVRMFTVADTKSLTPQTDVKGEWKVCSPSTVADFSAIGYLFARDLNQALKVPVGVILSAYGATPRAACSVICASAGNSRSRAGNHRARSAWRSSGSRSAPSGTTSARRWRRSGAGPTPAHSPLQRHDQRGHPLRHPRCHLVSGRVDPGQSGNPDVRARDGYAGVHMASTVG